VDMGGATREKERATFAPRWSHAWSCRRAESRELEGAPSWLRPTPATSRSSLHPPRGREMLTVKIRQPSHEFTFGVGISFIPYPLVLTPVV
jgi:hypothetical protein